MPELSRFYGIIIRMYFDDHIPAHFHAFYGEYEAVIGIESLTVLKGELPARARGLTIEWPKDISLSCGKHGKKPANWNLRVKLILWNKTAD